MSKEMIAGEVDPFDKGNHKKHLWCVFGRDFTPSMIVCVVDTVVRDDTEYGPNIWGYSVFEGKPGFCTLGITVEQFIRENAYGNAKFFDNMVDALNYIAYLTTPALDG